MSYTRARPAASTSASATTPQRVQIKPTTPMNAAGDVTCPGHGKRAAFFTAGQNTKNPGRGFYTCPLGRDDPSRCKFFKWADELEAERGVTATPSRGGPSKPAGQVLGQSPASRFGRPGQPNSSAPAIPAPRTAPRPPPPRECEDIDEIDWDHVDTDEIERDAITSTPSSSQQTQTQPEPLSTREQHTGSFNARLLEAAEDGPSKRKREDDQGVTPKRANPFVSSPSHLSPPHHALTPTLNSLHDVSEQLLRQERLIAAGEKMKEGFRKTIRNLQDRNKELEQKVRELEQQLAT
ncbi:hypothetical protein JCM24511_03937 [Saitozyma sp. JCM 24511]|nr:hypothetical protein JCM24511_03937 [Saitozyma sp. JCM 24511]